MIDAIYNGLIYGMMAGFIVLGFLITGTLIWLFIGFVDGLFDLTESTFSKKDKR